MPENPPTTRTRPDGSSDAVAFARLVVMSPVRAQVPVVASYSSAVWTGIPDRSLYPPITRASPSASEIAMCPARSVVILPVAVHWFVPGS